MGQRPPSDLITRPARTLEQQSPVPGGQGVLPSRLMLQTLLTACPLDCPDSCSLHVDVEDGRLLRVDAAPVGIAANAFTQGFICKKVKHHADRVYGPDRVLTPIVRVGPSGPLRINGEASPRCILVCGAWRWSVLASKRS